MRRRNLDRRNGAGGLGEGERTVRKGGWVQFGDDLFWSDQLEKFAGHRVYIHNLEDAFSPVDAYAKLDFSEIDIRIFNLYHLACKNKLPSHLEFLRKRMGTLTTFVRDAHQGRAG